MSVDSFQDIRRNFDNVNLFSHIYRLVFNPSYRLIWMFRLLGGDNKLINKILAVYYNKFRQRYMFELVSSTKIGSGIHFPHHGPIVINPKSIIGENCIIHPCTLIGGDRKTGAPIIGDNVFIGHGSKLIGKIKIGDNVFISPGAIVTKDINSDSIVGAGINNVLRSNGGKIEVERYKIGI